MIEEVNHEKQRAVLGKGPHTLSSKYSHHEVPPLKWIKMTQKQNLFSKGLVDPAAVDSAVDGEVNVSGSRQLRKDLTLLMTTNFQNFCRLHGSMVTKLFNLMALVLFPMTNARGQCYFSRVGEFTPLKSVREARSFPVITAVHDLRSVVYESILLLWLSKWES